MKRLLEIIILVVLFLLGYRFGCRSVETVTTETLRIDTVFYPKPEPVRVLPPTFVSVKVPRLLFAPADTVVRTVTIGHGSDSVQMDVPVRTLEYRDSNYYARVVGPVVGPLMPRLDYIETYNRTITRQQTNPRRSRFALTAGIGAAYTPKGLQPTIGIQAGVVLWEF